MEPHTTLNCQSNLEGKKEAERKKKKKKKLNVSSTLTSDYTTKLQ